MSGNPCRTGTLAATSPTRSTAGRQTGVTRSGEVAMKRLSGGYRFPVPEPPDSVCPQGSGCGPGCGLHVGEAFTVQINTDRGMVVVLGLRLQRQPGECLPDHD